MKKINYSIIYILLIYIVIHNNSIDSVFKCINERIDEDIKAYVKCKHNNKSNFLLCGRSKTKYILSQITYKPHTSYFSCSIINNCKKYNIVECSNTLFLVGILTRPECIYERIIARRIFKHINNVKFLFITGISTNENTNSLLNKEIHLFNDIILFDVINSYYNCSIIMSCFYIYIYKNCKNIMWIIKLDIDTYVNLNLLVKMIDNFDKNISVIGKINKNQKLKCNTNNKWSISCLKNSNVSVQIPSYPFGPGFVFRFSSITCINSYFNDNNKIIWIEDIFFGVLMKYCNLTYYDVAKYTEITYKPKYNLSITRNNIFVHGFYPIELYLVSIL